MGRVKPTVIQAQRVTLDQRLDRSEDHPVIPGPGRPERQDRRAIPFLSSPVGAVVTGDDFSEDWPVVRAAHLSGHTEDPKETHIHRLVGEPAHTVELGILPCAWWHPSVVPRIRGESQVGAGRPVVEAARRPDSCRATRHTVDRGKHFGKAHVLLPERVPSERAMVAGGRAACERILGPMNSIHRIRAGENTPGAATHELVGSLNACVPGCVHHGRTVPRIDEDVVGLRAVERNDSELGLSPGHAVNAGGIIGVNSVGAREAEVQGVIPHPIARAGFIRQDGAVDVDVGTLPCLVRHHHRIARVLLERMICPRDACRGRHGMIVHEELPGPGKVAQAHRNCSAFLHDCQQQRASDNSPHPRPGDPSIHLGTRDPRTSRPGYDAEPATHYTISAFHSGRLRPRSP